MGRKERRKERKKRNEKRADPNEKTMWRFVASEWRDGAVDPGGWRAGCCFHVAKPSIPQSVGFTHRRLFFLSLFLTKPDPPGLEGALPREPLLMQGCVRVRPSACI
jgi:hypothetical protein